MFRTRSFLLIGWLAAMVVSSPAEEISYCTHDADCHLNGVCNLAINVCKCDAAWTGPQCSLLNFLPAKTTACGPGCAFHGKKGTTTSSWGGNVLRAADGSGKYYLAAAEFANDCPLRSWTTNSVVSFAVSDTPDGPFEWQHTVVKPWAHNPQMIYSPADGNFVIYTLGDGVEIHGPVKDCVSPTHVRQPGRGQTVRGGAGSSDVEDTGEGGKHEVTFSLRYTDNPTSGHWKVHKAVIVDFPEEYSFPGNWNPAPLVMKDGSVRVMVHTNTSPWTGEVIVEAKTWRGPYRPITKDITTCKKCQEDPFWWVDKRGNYHLLVHRMFDPDPSQPLGAWSGGHSFSSDGKKWSTISRCFNTTVEIEGGEAVEFYRRERPKLIFSDDGVTPLYLLNGVQLEKENDVTYTLATPLHVDNEDKQPTRLPEHSVTEIEINQK